MEPQLSSKRASGLLRGGQLVPANFDTVRGLACILLVSFHVVGTSSSNGLRVPDDSGWRHLVTSFDLFRMPAFTILSGYLYGIRRVNRDRAASFLRSKLRRLAIPLLTLTVVLVSVRQMTVSDPVPIGAALVFGYQHLWYLQALLIIFALFTVIDLTLAPRTKGLAGICAIAVLLAQTPVRSVELFSLDGAVYLFPFFVFGMLLSSDAGRLVLRDGRIMMFASVVAAGVLVHQQMLLTGGTFLDKSSLLGIVGSGALITVALAYFPAVSLLQRIGAYSYTIYLWHALIAPVTRELVIRLGLTQTWAIFITVATAAIAGSVLLHKLLLPIRFASLLLLGVRGGKARAGPSPSARSDAESDATCASVHGSADIGYVDQGIRPSGPRVGLSEQRSA
jgi:surface polysaccharide O-acyltransferase-like enzyme